VAERTAALLAKQEHLAAILGTAADAIITTDEQGIIQSINPAGERMFGYPAPEMVGQNISLLLPSVFRDEPDSDLAHETRNGETGILAAGQEVVAVRKDGSVFWGDLAVSRVPHLKLITGILRDITQRKELEREVVEIAALEQQRIGQDLHDDCGQELTALGLLADSLVDSLHQNAPADVEVASKIEQGLRRVLRRVRSISRGLVQMEVRAADLPNALLELTSRLGETSGVRCTFHGDKGASLTNDIQATHLYHIAQEACTNALKHGQARNIRVHLSSTDSDTVLEISNDGLALPQQLREGLGMRILRNRANVIGARLTLAPSSGQGTVVTCLLPREPTHVPEP
jgi:PAS domain S-box-containing protein